MRLSARAASKTLALALCLALLRPEALLAAGQQSKTGLLPAVPVSLTIPSVVSFSNAADPAARALDPRLIGMAANAAATPIPALPAAAGSISAHPVLQVIDALQAKGVSLAQPATRAEAQQLLEAARALPEGSAKSSLVVMAEAALAPAGGDAPAVEAALQKAFEGSAVRAAAPAGGVWGALSRLGFLPSGLKKAIAAKAEKSRVKADARDPKGFEVPPSGLRMFPPQGILPESTRDLPVAANRIVGQDEALKAIRFGAAMPGKGYNLYVSGPDGSGRETAVGQILDEVAAKMAAPPDVVTATNFADPEHPLVLEVPTGMGPKLAMSVALFTRRLQKVVPEAMNSPELKGLKKTLEAAFERKVQAGLRALVSEVEKLRFQGGKFGMTMVVSKKDGDVEPAFPVTYRAADGGMKGVASEEEIQKLVAEGVFTADEWNKAVQESVKAEEPFREKFDAMHAANTQARAQIDGQLHMIVGKIATQAVEAEGGALVESLSQGTHNANTPEHKAWEARYKKALGAAQEKLGKAKIGKFRLALMKMGPMTLPVIVEGDADEPLSKAELEAKIKAGEITDEQVKDLIKKGVAIAQEIEAVQEKFGAEHDALHAAERAAEKQNNPDRERLLANALSYIQSLIQQAAGNYEVFLPQKADPEDPMSALKAAVDPNRLFRMSPLVTNKPGSGAPVVWDRSPSIEGTFGSAESGGKMMLVPGIGPVRTKDPGGPDLKAGRFPKARGGFYVVDVMDALRAPGFWPTLMRAVRNGEAEIAEDGMLGILRMSGDRYGIPAKVKVVLIGPPMIKMLLAHYDEDFSRNFNATAEFESSLKVSEVSTIEGYLQFMKQVIVKSGGELLDATTDGISALIEYAGRLVDSNKKVSAQFGAVHTLMREASFWAKREDRGEVSRADVEAALKARKDREGGFQKRYMERLIDRTFVIETDGYKVGQLNGLAVMGDFGSAMRITISATAGTPGLVSVDRDAKMTGQSFEKALGVVEGFLQQTFAQKKKISAHLRISFEQSYGGIDGDSATSTEIYGTLSALSGAPIYQGIAMTGSADQFGNVQAIGGVNEKIEGFFDLAVARGLNGKQGVIIPKSNVANLMLKPEVVQAVREGKFHIWAVDHVSQGIEILTGTAYSEIVRKVEARLDELRAAAK